VPNFSGIGVYHVHQFDVCELGIQTSTGSLKRAFGCQLAVASVKKALRNGLEPPKPRGGHEALLDDSEADILPSTRTEQTASIIVPVSSATSSLAGGWLHSHYDIKTI
jgi:hypothetical protein